MIYEWIPACSVRIKRAGSAGVVNGLRFEGPFIIPGTWTWPSEKAVHRRVNRRGQKERTGVKGGVGCWIKEGVRIHANERNGRGQQWDEKRVGGIRRNKRGIFVAVRTRDFSAPPTSAHAPHSAPRINVARHAAKSDTRLTRVR